MDNFRIRSDSAIKNSAVIAKLWADSAIKFWDFLAFEFWQKFWDSAHQNLNARHAKNFAFLSVTTSPWSRNSRIALIKIQDEARPWILPTRMKSCTRLLESDDVDNAKSNSPERLRFSWGCTAHQDFVEAFKQDRILPAADFAFWILPSTRFESETSKNSWEKASNPLTTA